MKQHIAVLFILLVIHHTKASPSSLIRDRIVGGYPARSDLFPWQAILTLCQNVGKSCGTCGGSLVSRNVILTAAHCTAHKIYFDIGLGSNHRFHPVLAFKSTVKVEHFAFNPITLENDVAMIRLPSDIQPSNLVQIIPLASSNIGSLLNQYVVVSGFGKTFVTNDVSLTLNYVALRIIDNAECARIFIGQMPHGKMCAVAFANTQTVCHGDSGGPLVMQMDGSYVQVGVVSFTYGRCVPGMPNGYARVSSYINWINGQLS